MIDISLDDDFVGMDVTFDVPIDVPGGGPLPQWFNADLGQYPITVVVLNATMIELTYLGRCGSGQEIIVPANDPGVRTGSNGYVNAGTFFID